MISQTAEYALRAMVHLAAHTDQPQTVPQIAAATQIPRGYLSKVLQSLTRGGLVHSQRGIGGGFSLQRTAAEISVYEIVQLVDPLQRILSCPLKLTAHRHRLCPLHQKLDQAMAQLETSFRETSLVTLIDAEPQTAFAKPSG